MTWRRTTALVQEQLEKCYCCHWLSLSMQASKWWGWLIDERLQQSAALCLFFNTCSSHALSDLGCIPAGCREGKEKQPSHIPLLPSFFPLPCLLGSPGFLSPLCSAYGVPPPAFKRVPSLLNIARSSVCPSLWHCPQAVF